MTSGNVTATWCTNTSYLAAAPASFISMVSPVTLEPDYECTLERSPLTLGARSLTSANVCCWCTCARSWQAQLRINCTLKLDSRARAGAAATIWPFAHAEWASMKGGQPTRQSRHRAAARAREAAFYLAHAAARAPYRVLGPFKGVIWHKHAKPVIYF